MCYLLQQDESIVPEDDSCRENKPLLIMVENNRLKPVPPHFKAEVLKGKGCNGAVPIPGVKRASSSILSTPEIKRLRLEVMTA